MVFVCISAAVFSTSLLTPFTVVNSHVGNYENTDIYLTYGDYDARNLNPVHEMTPTTYNQAQPNSVLDVEFHEDFTGDSVSFLVNANNLHK
jgi:hypothetical protein